MVRGRAAPAGARNAETSYRLSATGASLYQSPHAPSAEQLSARSRRLGAKLAFEPRNVIVEACGVSAEDIEHVPLDTFR